MDKKIKMLQVLVLVTLIIVVAISYKVFAPQVEEETFILSGSAGEPYMSTTTPTDSNNVDLTLKTSFGVLGSVIITGAGANVFELYNATTTDVNLRTGNAATSSLLLASFPASTAAGVYEFNTSFNNGLLLDITTSGTGTSTITWN